MSRNFLYIRSVYADYGFKRAAAFGLQVLLHQKAFAQWFSFIETGLPQGIDDGFKTRLAMKPATRFISKQFDVAARIDALTSYYQLLTGRLSPEALSVLFTDGYQIAEMTGKSGKKYILKVLQHVSKEGVLSIRFIDPEINGTLGILTGIISLDSEQHPVFTVGMLRGPGLGLADGKQMVVNATRDLNGLRPKQAAVHAAVAVALWFGAQKILAPSSQNEIPIKNWFKGYKIKADHDTFWEEFSKEIAPDGNYHLLLPLSRRDVSEVQQKRRKDWLLRYKTIDDFSAGIKETLDKLAR